MTQKMIIRADANTQIGTGHVMRCIALAQAWQDQGGTVTFLGRCESEALRQRIIDEGFDFIPIEKPHPDPSDLEETLKSLLAIRNPQSAIRNWLVLDGYHFTPDYQRQIKKAGHRLLVIDDMAHLDHYHADILLNQNVHASKLHYFCDRDTLKLLGCEYVLFRREFLKYKSWRRQIPNKAKNVLVTMGGSDPDNVTLKVIEALNTLNTPGIEVKIVVGPSNPHFPKLRDVVRHAPCAMDCVKNETHMPELMAWADLAVTAGGSTCWELAFMGVPFIVLVLAENQESAAPELHSYGAAISLDGHIESLANALSSAIQVLITGPEKCQQMCIKGRNLVIGDGAEHVLKAMSQTDKIQG